MQEYEEISDHLNRLVEGVRSFVRKEKTLEEVSDLVKGEMHHLLVFGKRVGGKLHEDVQALQKKACAYLQNSDDPGLESAFFELCLLLKNNLWEL